MKIEKIILILFLLISSATFSQKNISDFYEIKIYKLSKKANEYNRVNLKIDSLGTIKVKNKIPKQIIDLMSFNASIKKFITEEQKNILKIEGDNEERKVSIQEPHNQNIYFTITLLEDYHNEPSLRNKTSYMWREFNLSENESNYSFYKYFSNENITLIKNLLE